MEAHTDNYNSKPLPFDTLRYAKQMHQAGFTMEQAELQAETFLAIVQELLVSKIDLKDLENNLTYKLEKLASKTEISLKEIDAKTTTQIELVRRDIKELEVKTASQIELMHREIDAKTTTQIELVRRDIKELEAKTTTQIKELEVKTTTQIKELEAKTTTQIKELEVKITASTRDLKIWMGRALIASVLSMSTLFAFFTHLGVHAIK
jgi:hypothetical protein